MGGSSWQDIGWVVNCFYVWSINEQIYGIYTDGDKDEWDLDGL